MKPQPLTIGVVQHHCSTISEDNWLQIEGGLQQAAGRGAELVLLQELHNNHYFCQQESAALFDLAELIPGPSTERLGELARTLNIVIVASLFERRTAGLYHNTAVVIEHDGTVAGKYRKMHIPDDPGFYEKYYFAPGDLGFTAIETSVGKLGILVCWDQWFPEAARLMALSGAELLLFPTAIGWDPHDDSAERQRQRDAWITIQRAHAIANGLPIVVCNRTGFEAGPSNSPNEGKTGIQFWGSSFVAGPQGELLAEAAIDADAVIVVEIERQRCEQVRREWPYLRDRRIDAYGDLTKRFCD